MSNPTHPTSFQPKSLVATDADILRTARVIHDFSEGADAQRTTYLRMLVASTQDALGLKLRKIHGTDAKLSDEERAAQVAALGATHKRFYALILEAFSELVPSGTKGRAVELHRRANFARTALSAVRSYLRAGHDLGALAAARVIKTELAAATPGRGKSEVTPERLASGVERRTQALLEGLAGLADADRAAAITEAQSAIASIAEQLMSLGVTATKNATKAAEDFRPLRIGASLFMPANDPGMQ